MQKTFWRVWVEEQICMPDSENDLCRTTQGLLSKILMSHRKRNCKGLWADELILPPWVSGSSMSGSKGCFHPLDK